ncbi:hypothetical protein FIBSPDRAFT_229153 [Athelia psychrophila]|uniref:F-box domain-containing protein n=1 Tax=Athelia psychrophila TaxID=1759441 RepID=A0A165YQZ8_9AGAM|nr:hypothetical protein FIBSPDRAFT_229153 [Fibularhizoctonia sp. CBS 109695]
MVCRDWVPRSGMNQFESLNFARHSSNKRLSSFLDLLSSPHATITPHVRQIILNFGQGKTLIPKSAFMRIGALFALQAMTVNEYTPDDHPGVEDIVTILGSLVELIHLELHYCSLKSFSQLRAMICACRRLKRLCIRGLHPSLTPPQTPVYMPLECPPLRVLKLSQCVFAEQLLSWLESCVLPLPLSSLWVDSATFLLCGRLTRALGSKLEHLSICYCINTYYKRASSDEELDLRYNSQLRTLSF